MNRLRLRRILRAELGRALKQYPGVGGTAREAPAVASSGASPSPAKPAGRRVAKRRDLVGTPSPLRQEHSADIAAMIGRFVSPIGADIAKELGGGMAEVAVDPPAPLDLRPGAINYGCLDDNGYLTDRGRKLIDLSTAPSSMETQAERWAAKG